MKTQKEKYKKWKEYRGMTNGKTEFISDSVVNESNNTGTKILD
jgi:hypothetical protein